MGGGGGDGGASQARADEQRRQAEIRAGTERINRIWDGGLFGAGQIGADAVYDPSATYYTADGSVWSPTPLKERRQVYMGGSGEGGDREYRTTYEGTPYEQQFAEAVRAGNLFSGTEMRPGQFTDEFFDQQRQRYIDYAQPQLDQQFADAQKQLAFALSRGGILDSSTRAEKEGELQRLYDTNAQQIADRALQNATNSRNAVESARSDLIATLNATGDVQSAVNSANARATALSQPAAYDPLGQLFGNFLQGLGTQAALERANYLSGGQVKPTFQTGLFAPSTGSTQTNWS